MEATTSMPPDFMKSSDNEVLDIPNASSKEELSSSKKNCQMFQGHSDARGIAFVRELQRSPWRLLLLQFMIHIIKIFES